ncbi:IclR family transcriptional regulator [Saccharopolyspora sp. NPDC002686]|uniref:IclR family transcriptional regulator n=1 Tax=Saccharopolyspora sp. NPDC002686 TaxID=3154541 RepID=UPI00331A3948
MGTKQDQGKTDMVGKALRLLVLLGDQPDGTNASELSRLADLPFSTTYRLLGSLTRNGFVQLDPDSRRYRLGLRVFQLGQRVAHAHGFAGAALPVLQRVTETTHEATLLQVVDDDRVLTAQKVDGPQKYRITSDPGGHELLHSTSSGKVLVAFSEPAESKRLVAELDLAERCPNTITAREVFRQEIERIQQRGYATNDEENDPGMRAIAVPVLDSRGIAIASLATAVPAFRYSVDELTQFVPLLKEAAEELAVRLPLH